MGRRIIISASSDIGTALAHSWMRAGHQVTGTFRTRSAAVDDLESAGMSAVECDLSDNESVEAACRAIISEGGFWDTLVLAPGAQEPVGPFMKTSFDEWETSVIVNFSAELRVIHKLFESRDTTAEKGPCVLLFAGGGTNNAPVNYSAYTISKIGLIKMCELLDAENPDTRFTIIGPGWVDTKIHEPTLRSPEMAGDNYQKTIDKLASDEMVSISTVVECCDWVVGSNRATVGGRNFSLVFDGWGDPKLNELLQNDLDMYKLRRSGNDRMVRNRLGY